MLKRMKNDNKKIFIATWREGKNFGDDYLSLSLKKFLKEKFSHSSIIETNLRLDNYSLTKKDILIIGGGGLWGPSGTGKLENRFYLKWMNTKAQLIIANIGIESFDPSSGDQLIDLCNKTALFSLRDETSWLIVKKVIGEGKAFWAADNSYLNPIQIKRKPISRCIGVNLCGPEQENYRKNYSIDSIIRAISKLSRLGYSIRATVLTYEGSLSDYRYCKQIDPTCPRYFSIVPYRDCDLFIGMHFHSIVLALQNCVPVISINYSDKVKRIMDEYGLGAYCLEPADPELFDKMLSRINTMDKSDILNRIREGNENARQRLIPFKNKMQLIVEKSNNTEKVKIMANLRNKLNLVYMNLPKKLCLKLRWKIAQKGERLWWENWFKEHQNDDAWLNTVLEYFDLKENQDFGNKTLVDIGSGPIGILTKLRARERIAMDPLPIESVDETIKRIEAPGERIPLLDETADCVFVYNVLQHVIFPEKVLEEGTRILKKGGIFYILEQLNLPTDKMHLHSLRIDMFENWIKRNNFIIIKKTIEKDCYFDHPDEPGSGYSIICLVLKKE